MIKFFSKFNRKVEAYCSTVEEGNMSFKWTKDDDQIIANRRAWFKKINFDLDRLVTVNQPHRNNVLLVDKNMVGRGSFSADWIEGYDGLVTNDETVILGIETADCMPVFLYDPLNKIIGLAHAGWRGVVANIAAELVKTSFALGAQKDALMVAIGPHIQSCCFKVKEDVADQFRAILPVAVETRQGEIFVDMQRVVVRQLIEVGIKRENIVETFECTSCLKKKYFSRRRDQEKNKGSMLSVIKLKI